MVRRVKGEDGEGERRRRGGVERMENGEGGEWRGRGRGGCRGMGG